MPLSRKRCSNCQHRSAFRGSHTIFLHRVSLFGFEVNVDVSWLLFAVLIAWTLAGSVFPFVTPGLTAASYWVMAGFATAGLLISIVFHETAHSLVARHYDIPIRGITLFIFGGVAEMTGEPRRPRDELLMAAAGPAASLLLAAVFYALLLGVTAWESAVAVAGVLWYLALINFILAVFNLVPAFPLDGGRMFRAALWSWRGDLVWATVTAKPECPLRAKLECPLPGAFTKEGRVAEGLLLMSGQERERSHVVRQAVEHLLSQQEGSERLGISVRQFKRLVRAWKRDGAAGLLSRQRGGASHNRLADAERSRIMGLLNEKYADFGPTFAAEKLLSWTASRSRGRRSASFRSARGCGSRSGGGSGGCFRRGSGGLGWANWSRSTAVRMPASRGVVRVAR
jgi:Zn-dependent protease/transposase